MDEFLKIPANISEDILQSLDVFLKESLDKLQQESRKISQNILIICHEKFAEAFLKEFLKKYQK